MVEVSPARTWMSLAPPVVATVELSIEADTAPSTSLAANMPPPEAATFPVVAASTDIAAIDDSVTLSTA